MAPVTPPAGTLPYGLSGSPGDYGPKEGLAARSTYTGPSVITTNGAVIENVDIVGGLTIAANNVTVRNARFTTPSSWTWQQANNFVTQQSAVTGLLLEDVSFDGRDSSGVPVVYDAVAGYGRDVTVRRCDAQRVGNMIEFSNGLVEDCYLHDIWQAGPASGWHADGIQADGGDGITVQNNYIAMGRPPAGYWSQTSAIGMWADLGNLRNVLVTHNVIEPLGGFLFYAGATNGTGYTVSNVQFTENVVRTAGALPGDYGIWYQTRGDPILAILARNVYEDGTAAS